MIKTIKILMRITRRSDEDATTKHNPLRAMHLKKSEEPQNRALHFYFTAAEAFSSRAASSALALSGSPLIMPASMWILPSSSNRRISVWVEFSDRLF